MKEDLHWGEKKEPTADRVGPGGQESLGVVIQRDPCPLCVLLLGHSFQHP